MMKWNKSYKTNPLGRTESNPVAKPVCFSAPLERAHPGRLIDRMYVLLTPFEGFYSCFLIVLL